MNICIVPNALSSGFFFKKKKLKRKQNVGAQINLFPRNESKNSIENKHLVF
jgi:hypothetical protein